MARCVNKWSGQGVKVNCGLGKLAVAWQEVPRVVGGGLSNFAINMLDYAAGS